MLHRNFLEKIIFYLLKKIFKIKNKKVIHSFLQKSISKNPKTNYTNSKKGRNIFLIKKYKKNFTSMLVM
ncbi:MAG: hypothetical protein ACD_18C00112G0004 [uncultured bacterium]|nr:MAG: hypothetical protein ACD_18C00112G0004 [uncultured bacterium]OGH84488.1 MAG: hypothetical protein A2488_01415 [Candidatus Magasanikbacteria bacterium RIFOXYC12_FULL_32_21b]OGH91258.1 MAG: hypothetical protein A2507_04440 [Candidatus Magasanikbacteria bacterium RIFOXYD12_FULL_33_17]HAO52507.1 hypothetical protein [Candidatus Magasanikbacteria bacterium]